MMGVLYDVETHTINYHLKKVFSDSELEEGAVIRKFRITATDGKSYHTQHYNLAAIIAVGYKVNSERKFYQKIRATLTGLRMWDKRQRGYRAMGYRIAAEAAVAITDRARS
jgi:hypothetical protein